MTLAKHIAQHSGRPYSQAKAMPLAHHWPEQYERCAIIAGKHVCRRCLFSWPTALIAAIGVLIGTRWPESWDVWMLLVLPIPAMTEFVLEQHQKISYSAARNVALTLPTAFAFGVGMGRYFQHPTDLLFWGVCLFYGTIAVAAIMTRPRPQTAHQPG